MILIMFLFQPIVRYSSVLLVLLLPCQGLILSQNLRRSIAFPLVGDYTPDHDQSLMNSFDLVVHSTDFFVASTTPGSCTVPLFGDDVIVSFAATSQLPITEYVLTIQGSNLTQSDVAWIWIKFLECQSSFEKQFSSTAPLRKAVAQHYNSLPPHPGYNAHRTKTPHQIEVNHYLKRLDTNVLETLKLNGYAVLDGMVRTTANSNHKLTKLLIHKTGQDQSVRRDTVAFLDENDATFCGLELQYNLLMSIASHLNEYFAFSESPFQPVAPGTHSQPLTNPKHIQAAEYGRDGFYVAHSDNSISETNVRNNYRCFTCILYCNEDWTCNDGGALRIYRDSTQLKVPAQALTSCAFDDVDPTNGRLVIFDSKLVHSVEPVCSDKIRRALTLWILRPEESGAKGDTYYFGEYEH